jgi:hypothetical protein
MSIKVRLYYVIAAHTGSPRMDLQNLNHELLASCRTRKKYFKNYMSKNKKCGFKAYFLRSYFALVYIL